jgi:hypothetical protein
MAAGVFAADAVHHFYSSGAFNFRGDGTGGGFDDPLTFLDVVARSVAVGDGCEGSGARAIGMGLRMAVCGIPAAAVAFAVMYRFFRPRGFADGDA